MSSCVEKKFNMKDFVFCSICCFGVEDINIRGRDDSFVLKSNIFTTLFADHLKSYPTFKLLLTSILLWEQLCWFLVWPWFWGEKCLVCLDLVLLYISDVEGRSTDMTFEKKWHKISMLPPALLPFAEEPQGCI